jgi:hypothetical protein
MKSACKTPGDGWSHEKNEDGLSSYAIHAMAKVKEHAEKQQNQGQGRARTRLSGQKRKKVGNVL